MKVFMNHQNGLKRRTITDVDDARRSPFINCNYSGLSGKARKTPQKY